MEDIVYPRTIGLDIHQKMIVCCFTAVQEDRTIIKETAEFETFKRGLKALASWCAERKPDVVVGTGGYDFIYEPYWGIFHDQPVQRWQKRFEPGG